MKIQTFSVIVGGNKCNACCPYCVSKMTGKSECSEKLEDINWRNFHKGCQFAKMSGVSTVLLTGKGEPLLYQSHISKYLEQLEEYNFPFIELQTNGIELPNMPTKHLEEWYHRGLTTVSLSCVHWDNDRNREIFGKKYTYLRRYIDLLHRYKFSVRLSCILLYGYIENISMVKKFIEICKIEGVEQFTIRPVNSVDDDMSDIEKWVMGHKIELYRRGEIDKFFKDNATLLLELAHGAKVYDYNGQNISINSCLTHTPNPDDIRQLIFFPDGHLYYSWTKKGAIII